MAERKNTNPFTEEDSNIHHPPNVYNPQPYPINPAEGNPWAATKDYQPAPYQQGHVDNNTSSTYGYGHGYNASSDSGSNYPPTYLPMPTPSVNSYNTNSSSYNYYDQNSSNAYSNNAYNNTPYNNANTNAYENSSDTSREDNVKGEADNNTTEVDEASTVNPGVETHDPNKLRISSQMVTSTNGAPNKWRLLSRFIQFIASVGAFAFIVSAKPVSKKDTPDGANKTAIIFLYIVSAVSIIYSFGHLIFYCVRRWGKKNKAPRWSLILIDGIIGASFGTLMVFLIKDFRCKIGDLDGWCDFYNTSIFFTVLAFVTYAVSFVWDIIGGFKRS